MLSATLYDRNDSSKLTEKTTHFCKVKRAASLHTSQRICSTFAFARPDHRQTGQFAIFTISFKCLLKYENYYYLCPEKQNNDGQKHLY